MAEPRTLVDGFARQITYLRLSVTDRCDLRCTYCMPERMQFLPRAEVLTLEELYALARGFMARGVRRIRLTGGEPLVRRDMIDLVRALGRHVGGELDEVTLTTNATQLAEHAAALADAGVRRINISLDTLDREVFHALSRRDALGDVLAGIDAARA
ncbi:MAG: radical SAM protein, partial [Sphingomonadaceae bacterium]|nr:radical SAM protein [Sphingomonadaceae bacterium]